jgi:hypothetical protein
LVIIDHYSKYTWCYLLENRQDLTSYIEEWYKFISNQLSQYPVKTILADGEFLTNSLLEFCSLHGIKHDTSEAYTSQHNGLTERTNRTIAEMVRCLLFDSTFESNYWCYAVMFAVYILNRIGKATLKWESPYHKYFGSNATYRLAHIRKFGSVGWMRRNPKDLHNKDKLSTRAIRIRLIGFGDSTPQYTSRGTYHVIDDSGKTYFARNCVFNESDVVSTNDDTTRSKELELNPNKVSMNSSNLHEFDCVDIPTRDFLSQSNNPRIFDHVDIPKRQFLVMTVAIANQLNIEVDPKEVIIPIGYRQAIESPYRDQWQKAMQEEIDSLTQREVYQLVTKPEHFKPVKCKWVYTIKLTPSGAIDRFKARLVAKGFTQVYQRDYFDTYSPVIDIMSFFYMFAWAIARNYNIIQVDVKTAFLYGDLDEEIYMTQPEGFVDMQHKDKVCKLIKSLYGLKQAPLCWNKKLNAHLTDVMHFTRLKTDVCVYMRDGAYLLVYVDDMLIIAESSTITDTILKELSSAFETKRLGFPELMLGLQFKIVQGGVIVHQSNYIDSLLERFQMQDCKGKETPLCSTTNYYDVNDESENIKNYQELLGSLLFASIRTRPDIAHSVSLLARFTNNPKKIHYQGLKSILRYLKATKSYGLFFKSGIQEMNLQAHHCDLKGYADASFADVITDKRKSSYGYCITLNGTAISWKATKTTIVVQSTCESEYVAMCQLTKQVLWLRNLRIELKHQLPEDTIQAYSDNQSALKFCKNQTKKSGMKHIDLKLYFTKEAIERKLISFDYVASEEMIADIFTKVLDKNKFITNRNRLGLVPIPKDQ